MYTCVYIYIYIMIIIIVIVIVIVIVVIIIVKRESQLPESLLASTSEYYIMLHMILHYYVIM